MVENSATPCASVATRSIRYCGNSSMVNVLNSYKKAASIIRAQGSDELIRNDVCHPIWLGRSDAFIYVRSLGDGKGQFRLVDVVSKSNNPLFDHGVFSALFQSVTNTPISKWRIPSVISDVDYSLSRHVLTFRWGQESWHYDIAHETIRKLERVEQPIPYSGSLQKLFSSPDGSRLAYVQDNNIHLFDNESGAVSALTSDGDRDSSYGLFVPNKLPFRWSNNGQKLLVAKTQLKKVPRIPIPVHLPASGEFRAQVHMTCVMAHTYEENIIVQRVGSLDVVSGEIVWADYPVFPQVNLTRFTEGNNLFNDNLAWWSADDHTAYFIHIDRYFKSARLVRFDTRTGETNILLEETTDTWLRLTNGAENGVNFLPLPGSDELIWYSERSGWGHLYLYNLKTGAIKRNLTAGRWAVQSIVRFNETDRELFVQTAGRVEDRNPYYADVVRINIDTGESNILAQGNYDVFAYSPVELTTEMGNFAPSVTEDTCHDRIELRGPIYAHWPSYEGIPCPDNYNNICGVSPTGRFCVVTRSRVDSIPETLVVDRDGNEIFSVETAEFQLSTNDWSWPETFNVKSADGATDLYGTIYRPSNFCEHRKYPIVNYVQNGTHYYIRSPAGSFNQSRFPMYYFDAAALAELGFVVVQLNGRGTRGRSKEFLDHSYGRLDLNNDLSDQVSGIEQLADRFSYIDMDRVGIVSMGFNPGAARGMLTYPDFFKVGVECNLIDDRMDHMDILNERFIGPDGPKDGFKYLDQLAGNLRGKLLLLPHVSRGTSLAAFLKLASSLNAANKNYDAVVDYSSFSSRYQIRRCWDYLVEHLAGLRPPTEFQIRSVGVLRGSLNP